MSDFYSIIEDLERKTMETLEETRLEYQELLRSFDINPRSTADPEHPRPQEPEQDFNLIENQGIDLQDDRQERMFQDLIQYDTGIDSDFWNDSRSSASGSSLWGDTSDNEIDGCTLNLQPEMTNNDESDSELPEYETMMSYDHEIPPQIPVHESSLVTAAAREASTSNYDQQSDSAEDDDAIVSSEMPLLFSAEDIPGLIVGAYVEVSTCNPRQQSESESEGNATGQEEAGPGQQEPPFMELIRSVRAEMTNEQPNDPLPCSSGLQVRRKKIALRPSRRRCTPYNQGPSYSCSVTPSCKRKAQQVYTGDEDGDDGGFGINGAVRPLPPVHRHKRIRVKADAEEDDADDEDSDEERSVAAPPPPPARRQRPKRLRVEAGAAQEEEDTDVEFEGNEAASPSPPEQRLKRPRVQAETSDRDSDSWLVIERLSHAETSEEETSASDENSGSDMRINQDLTSDDEQLALSTGARPPPTPGQHRKRVQQRFQILRCGRRVEVSPSPRDVLEFLAHDLRFNGFPIYEAVCVMQAIFDKASNMQNHWRRRGIDVSQTALESIILRDPTLWPVYLLMPKTREDSDLIREVVMNLADELQENVEPRPENQDDTDDVIWISSDDDDDEEDEDDREPEHEVYWVSSGSDDEDGDDEPAAIVVDHLNRQ